LVTWLFVGLAILGATLIPPEYYWPGVRAQRRFRHDGRLDLVYWFYTALITKPVTQIAVVIALTPLLWIRNAGTFENFFNGNGPLGRQPRLVQAVQLIVLIDFGGYWLHRALPLFTAYAIFLHANVRWDFGPLRRALANPRFHRWHHTSAADERDKNFAGLLQLWDILFGTYYLPARQPTLFGIVDAMPASLLGQLTSPFRRRQKYLHHAIL
jgi:sterol desaturase/sphingolipid hydroxylase (fatty acid hydroxylase superfamily)